MSLWTPEDGYALACELIETEKREKTRKLNLGRISLQRLPESIFELEHLEELVLTDRDGGNPSNADDRLRPDHVMGVWPIYQSTLGDGDLAKLGERLGRIRLLRLGSMIPEALKSLNRILALEELEVHQSFNLEALIGLNKLKTLRLRAMVTDIAALAGLPALQSLDLRNTQVSDVAALAGLPALQELDLLFLHLMTACGMCFLARKGDEEREIEPEYAAPDLLPDRENVADELVQRGWSDEDAEVAIVLSYTFLHHGVIRSIIAKVGDEALEAGVY